MDLAPRQSQFRYFKTSPEIIRLAVMLYNRNCQLNWKPARLRYCGFVHQAARTALRQVAIASARNSRIVRREVRWRWTAKVL